MPPRPLNLSALNLSLADRAACGNDTDCLTDLVAVDRHFANTTVQAGVQLTQTRTVVGKPEMSLCCVKGVCVCTYYTQTSNFPVSKKCSMPYTAEPAYKTHTKGELGRFASFYHACLYFPSLLLCRPIALSLRTFSSFRFKAGCGQISADSPCMIVSFESSWCHKYRSSIFVPQSKIAIPLEGCGRRTTGC